MSRRIRAMALSLAAVVSTVGASILAASPAVAFSVSSVATVTGGPRVLLAAGTAAQPVGNLAIAFADSGVSHVWSITDSITVQLWDGTSGSPLSNTTVSSFQNAGFSSTPTVSATNGVDSSFYGVALAKGATSTVNDEFVLTFAKAAPQDANTSRFTISGLKVTFGSRIPAGHHVQLKVSASNGTPFTGAASVKFVDVGVVPAMSMTVSSVATGGPSASNVAIGAVTLTDRTGAAVSSGDEIDLTLTSGFISAAGTLSGTLPAATAPAIVTVTNTSDTDKLAAVKTSVIGDALTLSGAKIVPSASPGEIYLVASDRTTSTVLGAVGIATVVTQTRVGGTDRYGTASQLFNLDFAGATTAVLTSGANYPDALSAIYLAGQLSTGVLTTDPSTLPAATRSALLAGAIKVVYIIGGTSAVSAKVATTVGSLHVANNASGPLITVVRIAGADRYATNKLVDTYSLAGATHTAIVATGENFADALAVGPAVYKTGDPLILTPGAGLSASAKATITALGITHAVIVGGTSAISASTETALGAAGVTVDYRIAGAERTQTAASVAAWETTGLVGQGIYPALGSLAFGGGNLINIARGDSFADALAAGSVAGADQTVIVLTSGSTTLGPGVPSYFAGRAGATVTLRAIGLAAALGGPTLTAAAASLTQPLLL